MRFLLVALLVSATWCTTAQASYPGERPAAPSTLALETVALAWWADHGITGCPGGVTVLEADSLLDTDGLDAIGRALPCKIWVRSDQRGWLRCITIFHETGHALGLDHEHPLMAVMDPSECRDTPTARQSKPHVHRRANVARRTGKLRRWRGRLQEPRLVR